MVLDATLDVTPYSELVTLVEQIKSRDLAATESLHELFVRIGNYLHSNHYGRCISDRAGDLGRSARAENRETDLESAQPGMADE
jgi:hypothetical protein